MIAAEHAQKCAWRFTTPESAHSVSGQGAEMVAVVEHVFDCAQPFVRVGACEITAPEYGPAVSLTDRFGHEQATTHERRLVADDSDGLSATAVRTALDRIVAETEATVIASVQFDALDTCVVLDGFEGYVGADDTERYRRRADAEWTDTSLDDGPLRITVSHTLPALPDRVGSDVAHNVLVETDTELWFGDDEIAIVNRKRLACVLSCLHTRLGEGTRTLGGESRGERDLERHDHLQCLLPWFEGL